MSTTSLKANDPESVMEIMTQLSELIDQQEVYSNRRMLPRRNLGLPIIVQLLDGEGQPKGESFEALSMDIAPGGVGFICRDKIFAHYALIQFRSTLGEHRPLLVELRHITTLGPFCKVGGSFCVDWSKLAEDEQA